MSPYDEAPIAYAHLIAPAPPAIDRDRVLERRRRHLLRKLGLGALGAIALLVAFGAIGHYRDHRAAMAALEERQHAAPVVRTRTVSASTDPRTLALPGTTQAFESATIYARQSGYIAQRSADIGTRVKAGDLLALVAAPEIDDQLAQARAQLAQTEAALKQAQANETLARATNVRTAKLAAQGWQTLQQADNDRLGLVAQTAAVGVAAANLDAQKAQVARLERAQSYERVIAPFDGVVTQRSIDTGSLVTADSTSGTSMFSVARTNVLRVQVYVPQDAAFGLKAGVPAEIQVPEIPGRTFSGKIARTADALQAGTRTLLAEVDIDNADGALTAGIYCTVHFQIPRADPVIVIPAEALIVGRDGPQVAVVTDGKAHFRKVQLAEDDGATVVIGHGLQANDRVIVSPPVDLVEGAPVSAPLAESETAQAKGG